MKMIIRFTFIISLISASFYGLQAKEKQVIAVLDLEAKNIPPSDADIASDFLRTDLANTGSFTVVERARINDVLKEQQLSLTGASDNKDAAKLGKLLNCKLIVIGTVSKLDEKYFINVRVVNVESGETVLGKRDSSDSLSGISQLTKSIAMSLAKGESDEDLAGASRYPVLGVDLYLGPHFAGQLSDLSALVLGDKIVRSGECSILDFRAGFYFTKFYIGYFSRNTTIGQGDSYTYSRTSNGIEVTNKTLSWTGDYSLSTVDFLIGYRTASRNKLNPKTTYLAWRTVTLENPILTNRSYAGPVIGHFNRNAIRLPSSLLSIIYTIDFSAGYLFFQKPAGWTGTALYSGLSYSGEAGIGIQLEKYGAYLLLTYALEGFAQIPLDSSQGLNVQNIINRGIQLKIGYNFDLPSLFK